MPKLRLVLLPALLIVGAFVASPSNRSTAGGIGALVQPPLQPKAPLQPNTLCAKNERVIFSCRLRQPAKVVSVCAAKNLTRETGYLQYRFGLPGKIELEFPKERQGSQGKFQYTHYFRAQVDLTEINFSVNGVNYSVFDDYNGEEKPAVSLEGVSVDQSGKITRLVCRTKPTADYSDLQAVLESGQ
ncbi:MAG TPA: hypothetical protein VJT71_16485 [Pyrinomonadaceae bacterium]|nr:hypothetical protein [Pyrinomonadaceae bacterium]